MYVGEREHHGQDKERSAVQKQIVAPHQGMKYRSTFPGDQAQQRVAFVDGVKTMEHDATSHAQAEREQNSMLDERSDEWLQDDCQTHRLIPPIRREPQCSSMVARISVRLPGQV